MSNSPDWQFPVDRDGAVHADDHRAQFENPSLQPLVRQFRGPPVDLVGPSLNLVEHIDDPDEVLQILATSVPGCCRVRGVVGMRARRDDWWVFQRGLCLRLSRVDRYARPRKTLNWDTPAERLNMLLHTDAA